MCGCFFATSIESKAVAPPTAQSVRYYEKSNFAASASKLMRERPVIATTVAQNLFLHLVHFPRVGSRLIVEAMQM
jgi:hypothetical protein